MRLLIHDVVVGVWVPGRRKEWTVRDYDGIKEANAEVDTVSNSMNVETEGLFFVESASRILHCAIR